MQAVLRLNRPAVEDRLVRAAAYLGLEGGFAAVHDFVGELNARIGIPAGLAGLGVTEPDIDSIVADALTDPTAAANPVKLTEDNLRAVLAEL